MSSSTESDDSAKYHATEDLVNAIRQEHVDYDLPAYEDGELEGHYNARAVDDINNYDPQSQRFEAVLFDKIHVNLHGTGSKFELADILLKCVNVEQYTFVHVKREAAKGKFEDHCGQVKRCARYLGEMSYRKQIVAAFAQTRFNEFYKKSVTLPRRANKANQFVAKHSQYLAEFNNAETNKVNIERLIARLESDVTNVQAIRFKHYLEFVTDSEGEIWGDILSKLDEYGDVFGQCLDLFWDLVVVSLNQYTQSENEELIADFLLTMVHFLESHKFLTSEANRGHLTSKKKDGITIVMAIITKKAVLRFPEQRLWALKSVMDEVLDLGFTFKLVRIPIVCGQRGGAGSSR